MNNSAQFTENVCDNSGNLDEAQLSQQLFRKLAFLTRLWSLKTFLDMVYILSFCVFNSDLVSFWSDKTFREPLTIMNPPSQTNPIQTELQIQIFSLTKDPPCVTDFVHWVSVSYNLITFTDYILALYRIQYTVADLA